MKIRGFTLIEVLIIAAIIATLAAIVIPNYLTSKRTANDAAAKANIHTMMSSVEVHFAARARYPTTTAEFRDFFSNVDGFCQDMSGTTTLVQGFSYACTTTSGGYQFVAAPANPGVTGTVTYTGSTGGILTPL